MDVRYECPPTAFSRCPTEIWRLIFDELILTVCSENTYLRQYPPSNGRDIMCQDISVSQDAMMERSVPVGFSSRWSLALRTRKQLVLVCKAWWAAATRDIYRTVYLHRIGQLPALVRTLEESNQVGSADEKSESESESTYKPTRDCEPRHKELGYGKWISEVTVDFHILPEWWQVYIEGFECLITLCPNLQTLIQRPVYSLPLLKNPLNDDLRLVMLGLRGCGPAPPSGCDQEAGSERVLSHLKHLTIGEPVLVPAIASQYFLDAFNYLTSLEISLSRLNNSEYNVLTMDVWMPGVTTTLPHLLSFAVSAQLGKWPTRQLDRIVKSWKMPNLQNFYILAGDAFEVLYYRAWPPDEVGVDKSHCTYLGADSVKLICKSYGNTLRQLYIDDQVSFEFDRSLFTEILNRCPHLVNLTFPCKPVKRQITLTSPEHQLELLSHPNIETVVLAISTLSDDGSAEVDLNADVPTDECTSIIQRLQNRTDFPKLKAVRLLCLELDDLYLRSPNDMRLSCMSSSTRLPTEALATPLDVDLGKCCVGDRDRQLILQWAGFLAPAGVVLQNHSHCRIAPLNEATRSDDSNGALDVPEMPEEIQAIKDDGSDEGDSDTSDQSYEDESASQTTSYEDSDVAEDSMTQHGIRVTDGYCSECNEHANAMEHWARMWWSEATPTIYDTSDESYASVSDDETDNSSQSAYQISEYEYADEEQISWEEALLRFEESMWLGYGSEDEAYETVEETDQEDFIDEPKGFEFLY